VRREPGPRSSLPLRLVHALVVEALRLGERGGRRRRRVADRGRERIAVEPGVAPERLVDRAGKGAAALFVSTGEEDGELVAADPGEHVAIDERRRNGRDYLLKELVAEVVAALVVGRLQPVGVDHDHARDAVLGR